MKLNFRQIYRPPRHRRISSSLPSALAFPRPINSSLSSFPRIKSLLPTSRDREVWCLFAGYLSLRSQLFK